jgi:hypothetical protein
MSDPTSAIAVAPIFDALTPIVVQVVGVVIAAAITFAAARFSAATGYQFKAGALARITAMAQSEGGAWILAEKDNLANRSIPVNSPQIAAIANKIAQALPGEMNSLGFTPSHVAMIVAGELGKLQASMTSVSAPSGAVSMGAPPASSPVFPAKS